MQSTSYRSLVLAVSMLMLTSISKAETFTLTSSAEPANVIELFTSHGCSSCPPAGEWLRGLVHHEDLWTKIIPIAFHVDYWDYLGWSDQFASAEYSDRQADYRSSGRVRTIYTPGFVVNGEEWRGFFRGRPLEFSPQNKVGILEVMVEPAKSITAKFKPTDTFQLGKLQVHTAVLGFGVSTEIGGGENSGRTLAEDFVVLGSSTVRDGEQMEWSIPWPTLKKNSAQRTAIVVWLSSGSDPAPVQAVGNWIN